MSIDSILIAVDGSECARRAAAFGLGVAETFDADATALYVGEPGSDGTDAGEDALAAVEGLADERGVAVETSEVFGKAHTAIPDRAEAVGADLLVMGRHGRDRPTEKVLGTVTDRVIRTVEVPVLTVPAGEFTPDMGAGLSDLLATTDGSEAAELAAPTAADLAEGYDALLRVLSVVNVDDAIGLFDAGGVDEEFVERLEDRAADHVDSFADEVGRESDAVETETAVVRGEEHRAIGEYAERHDVDLVIMASKGKSGIEGKVLGSVADRVLRTLNRPVVVVPA